MYSDHMPACDPDDTKRVVREVAMFLNTTMREFMGLPALTPEDRDAMEIRMAMQINDDYEPGERRAPRLL